MIASVVATLEPDSAITRSVLDTIDANPAFDRGPISDRRLPMTIEASDPESLERHSCWLRELPGVLFVDVVFVHFGDDSQFETSVQKNPVNSP